MKTVKILAALAVPAMFAACTSEDIVIENSQMAQNEIVGAELVGTGISLNVIGGDASSRIANVNGELKWTKTDLLGLGWLLTSDTAQEPQDPGKGPKNSYVWANNMFQLEEGDDQSVFTTKGNIYAGWQFAYYPYEYQDFPGSYKYITVNPTQKTMDLEERYSQGFHVSARQFITKTDLVDNKLTKSFSVKKAMNTLYMTTKPVVGSTFETGKSLANLEITSVTINAGKEVFTDKALLLAKNLPVQGEEFTNNMKGWIKTYKTDGTTEGRNVSLTTNIDADYFVSNGNGTNRIMPIALPTYEAVELNPNDVTIEIEAGAGKFTIAYVDEDSDKYNEWAALNNVVIEKLVAAYAEDGQMVNWTSFVQLGEIQLYDAIFAPDFKNVTAENWASKVILADYLNVAPEFELAPNAEIVLSSKLALPANGVTVMGTNKNKFIVDNSYTWTEKLVLGNTKVEVLVQHKDPAKVAKLTLNSGIQLTNKVTNNGQITVKGMTKTNNGATLGAKTGNLVNNGVVYVEYGAFVYPTAATKANSIVYKLPKNYNFGYINDMITTGSVGSANVNTLEINAGIELNCQKTTVSGGELPNGNPYNPSLGSDPTSTTDVLNLQGINLWINGTGKVSAAAPYAYQVNDVVMNGGELSGIGISGNVTLDGTSSISNGDIAGDVTVKGGEAIISNGDITGDVTVEAGTFEISNGDVTGNVTIAGTANISNGEITNNVTLLSGESNFTDVSIYGTLEIKAGATINMSRETGAIKVKNIINNGKLTSTSDINVEDIIADNCVIYMESTANAKDKVIWYSGNFKQIDGIELRGRILPVAASAFNDAISTVKKDGIITLNSDLVLDYWSDLNNSPSNVAYILDLNGNSLTVTNYNGITNNNIVATIKNGKIKTPIYIGANFKAENVIFEIDGKVGSAGGSVAVEGTANKVELTDCTFRCENAQPLNVHSGFNGTLTLTDCTFEYMTVNCFPYFNSVGNKAKINVTGCEFESPLATDIENTIGKFTFSHNKFNQTFDFTGTTSVANITNANLKKFINDVLANNDFLGTNRVAWWYGSGAEYINSPF